MLLHDANACKRAADRGKHKKIKIKSREHVTSAHRPISGGESVDALLELMDSQMKGGAAAEPSLKKRGQKASKKRPRPPEGTTIADARLSKPALPKAVQMVPSALSSTHSSNSNHNRGSDAEVASTAVVGRQPSSEAGAVSDHELWNPAFRPALDDLNLPWAGKGVVTFQVPQLEPRGEVSRAEAVCELEDWFTSHVVGQASASHKAAVAAPRAFHLWLRGAKLRETRGKQVPPPDDPVLPEDLGTCQRDLNLARLLTTECSMSVEAAVELCEELGAKSVEISARLRSEAKARKRLKGREKEKDVHPPVLRSRHHQPCLFVPLEGAQERLQLLQHNEAFDVSLLKGHELRINAGHYHKLKAMYFKQHIVGHARRQTPGGALSRDEEHVFHERLGCLLFRYQALAGKGCEWQMEKALPARFFDFALKRFGSCVECFASPFNSRYGVYCSPFWDTDGFFGSLGSFFEFEPLQGCFIAHPPFIPDLVDAMTQHMERLLARTPRRLGFIVVAPHRTGEACVKRVRSSRYVAWEVAVGAGKHGFCIGMQHFKPRTHVEAEEESVVMLLQSRAAQADGSWALTPEVRCELLDALASFRAEDSRDRLAPPPREMTMPASKLQLLTQTDDLADVMWWKRDFKGKKV